MIIKENSIHIRIPYLKGTWKVISTAVQDSKKIFLLESEQQPGVTTTIEENGRHIELK